jgi:Protein of unknown function (DUF3102)
MTRIAVKTDTSVDRPPRPLKDLVPLIKDELAAGQAAGLEHYRRAGEMLLEARELVAVGQWSRWLSQNFKLSRTTAGNYMRLAARPVTAVTSTTLSDFLGKDKGHRASWYEPIRQITERVNVTALAQESPSTEDEVRLHRILAGQLIDLGYRALATRLHPDRGGSRDAMRRLNRVREELTSVAKTRRYV